VIIGILAAALIPRLQSVQARARDTKRKADLHQVATALEIYKEDNGSFIEFAHHDNCNLIQFVINPGQYSTIFWPSSDDPAGKRFAYSVLSKYMTSVPSDSDTSARISDGCDPIHWYYMSILNRVSQGQDCYGWGRNWWRTNSEAWNCPANSFILNARMESAGSSNRVTNLYNLSNYDDCGSGRCPTTWSNGRIWAVGSFQDNKQASSSLYQSFMCTKVTDSWDTTNDGNGICRVDPNNTSKWWWEGSRNNGWDWWAWSEYRYIYTN